ncbi:MAG TPA: hypothetical protein VM093_02580 [Aeromicrobium sp.]|nr:hypothetical protein [Aeromicrobium sp.]
MGLPHLDFRVPESGWFKAALERVQFGPMLSSSGSLSVPYKIAIVAVMALVACGTLVTFGTADAETTRSSYDATALPGTNEVSPQVQGQVLPPTQSLLTSQDLLATLNLTDYSPVASDTDNDDSDDQSDDNSDKGKKNKKKATSRTSARPTTKATATTKTTTAPKPAPTTTAPKPAPTTAVPNPVPTTSAPKPSPSPTPKPTKPPCNDPTGITCALRDGG